MPRVQLELGRRVDRVKAEIQPVFLEAGRRFRSSWSVFLLLDRLSLSALVRLALLMLDAKAEEGRFTDFHCD